MKDKYIINAKLADGSIEVVDSASTIKEARLMKKEYQMAFGNNWMIFIEVTR